MLVYGDLTSKILEAATEVYNELGYGFLEKVYERALIHELKIRDLKVESQKSLQINYKGQNVGNYYADIFVDDKVIIELKSGNVKLKDCIPQILNYLKATNKNLGLIINFGPEKLEVKRVISGNPDT